MNFNGCIVQSWDFPPSSKGKKKTIDININLSASLLTLCGGKDNPRKSDADLLHYLP